MNYLPLLLLACSCLSLSVASLSCKAGDFVRRILVVVIVPLLVLPMIGSARPAHANNIIVNCGELWQGSVDFNAPVHTQIGAYETGNPIVSATVDYGDGARMTSTGVTSNSGCGQPSTYYHYPDIMVGWYHNYTTVGTYNIGVTLTDSSGYSLREPEGSVTVRQPPTGGGASGGAHGGIPA